MGWLTTGGRGLETALGFWVFVAVLVLAVALYVWHTVTIGNGPPAGGDGPDSEDDRTDGD